MAIEQLCMMSLAIKRPQHPLLYSVSFVRMQGKKVGSSTMILEIQAAWNLLSNVSVVALVQLPCQWTFLSEQYTIVY